MRVQDPKDNRVRGTFVLSLVRSFRVGPGLILKAERAPLVFN